VVAAGVVACTVLARVAMAFAVTQVDVGCGGGPVVLQAVFEAERFLFGAGTASTQGECGENEEGFDSKGFGHGIFLMEYEKKRD
jgi:hypothetical protein